MRGDGYVNDLLNTIIKLFVSCFSGNDSTAQNDWKGAWWHSSFSVHSGYHFWHYIICYIIWYSVFVECNYLPLRNWKEKYFVIEIWNTMFSPFLLLALLPPYKWNWCIWSIDLFLFQNQNVWESWFEGPWFILGTSHVSWNI